MSAGSIARAVAGALSIGALVAIAPVAGVTMAEREWAGARAAPARGDARRVPEADASAAPEELVGVLLPPQMANLSPRIDLKVLEIRARAGQAVRKGDVIVAFDLRSLRHDYAMAAAQLKVARADEESASSDLTAARSKADRRTASVHVAGEQIALVSGEEAAQARSDVRSAAAHTASASARIAEQEVRVSQLRLALEESELRAPFDGVVSAVNVEAGTTAHTEEVVARVVGVKGLRVRIAVPERSASSLGAPRARLRLDDRTLLATVTYVAPEVEPASRVFVVEGVIDDYERVCAADCKPLVGRTVRATLISQ